MSVAQTFHVTDQMKDDYFEKGFFITDVLFEENELAAVRDEMNRIWKDAIANAKEKGDESYLKRVSERPFLDALHYLSDTCKNFLRHPVMIELGRSLIGEDVDNTYNQAVIKPPIPDGDNHFAWHQDGFYPTSPRTKQHWDPKRVLDITNGHMCWIALTETTIDNGTLWVVPNQHKQGFLPHEWDEAHNEWVAELDTSEKIPVCLQPGQMLVFTTLTPHYSGPNVSDNVRMVYQFGQAKPGTNPQERSVLPVLRDGVVVSE